ncbi:hypothetical protein Lal_00035267 [Lupinus albus]|nr:hypothetical protein Lal_00035267 [Lupinus albus]
MDHIGLDPIIYSLLTLQEDHVTFRARYNFWQHLPAKPVLQAMRNTAFGNILDIGASEINNHLITALVIDSHFPFTQWECTITLEDVTYQLGLSIDRDVVTGATNMDWDIVCLNLLGAIPTDRFLLFINLFSIIIM